jgi:hypothetical protein
MDATNMPAKKKSKPLKNKVKSLVPDKKVLLSKSVVAKVATKAKKSGKPAPVTIQTKKIAEKAKGKVKAAIEKVVSRVAKVAKSPPQKSKTVAEPKAVVVAKAKAAAVSPEKSINNKAKKPSIAAPILKEDKTQNLKSPGLLALKKGKKPTEPLKAEIAPKKASAKDRNRCREPGCDSDAILSGYCRLHYIKNWKRIKKKESILSTGQLEGYVEELVGKYPDKYLDAIENDLASEKEWGKVIADLELGAGEDDFVSEDEDGPIPEAAARSRGPGFDDEDEDVY